MDRLGLPEYFAMEALVVRGQAGPAPAPAVPPRGEDIASRVVMSARVLSRSRIGPWPRKVPDPDGSR